MNYHESEYTDMGIILQDVISNIEEREQREKESETCLVRIEMKKLTTSVIFMG